MRLPFSIGVSSPHVPPLMETSFNPNNSANRWYIWACSYSTSAPRTEQRQVHTEQETRRTQSRSGPFPKGKKSSSAESRTVISRLSAVCSVEACQNFTVTLKFRAITTFVIFNVQTFRTVICGPVYKSNGSPEVKFSHL